MLKHTILPHLSNRIPRRIRETIAAIRVLDHARAVLRHETIVVAAGGDKGSRCGEGEEDGSEMHFVPIYFKIIEKDEKREETKWMVKSY